jgi:S-adenosylmethionine decarboxylase
VAGVDEGFDAVEKTVVLYYHPDAASGHVPPAGGLTALPEERWTQLLDHARCKILSSLDHPAGAPADQSGSLPPPLRAYLLSESSLFVAPHSVTLKTCGTTTLLHALPHLVELAAGTLGPGLAVVRYTRGEYLFPVTQTGPHSSWAEEVGFLQGKLGGSIGSSRRLRGTAAADAHSHFVSRILPVSGAGTVLGASTHAAVYPVPGAESDARLEIVLRGVPAARLEPFCNAAAAPGASPHLDRLRERQPHRQPPAEIAAARRRFSDVFASTRVDEFDFAPCGYSGNGVTAEGRWWTVHLSPDAFGADYVSFETDAVSRDGQGCAWALRLAEIFDAARVSVRVVAMDIGELPAAGGARALACTVDGLEAEGYAKVADDTSGIGPHAAARLVTLTRDPAAPRAAREGFEES